MADLIYLTHLLKCPGGGIGRRSRLKICRSQGCAGSIPVPGTKAPQICEGFFFNNDASLFLSVMYTIHIILTGAAVNKFSIFSF
jgi:hypothetical protein